MAAPRRHLPVLQTPKAAASAPVGARGEGEATQPPWHWVPLGTTLSVLTFALFASGAARVSTRIYAATYGAHPTAAEVAAVRAARPVAARGAELAAGLVPLAALLAAVALGGWFVGRFGRGTSARHGTLSGLTTAVLFWAVTGRMGALLAVVPVAMAVGYGAARWGVWRRDRA